MHGEPSSSSSSSSGTAWEEVPGPHPFRTGHQAVFHEGKMYIFGGRSEAGLCSDLLQYDFKSNVWSHLGDGTQYAPREGHLMVLWNDNLIIFGGLCKEAMMMGFSQFIDHAILHYSLRTHLWVDRPDMAPDDRHHGRVCPAGALYGNQLLIFGGMVMQLGDIELTKSLLAFDLSANQWHPLPEPDDVVPRFKAGATIYNDRLYIYGGYGNPESDLGLPSKPEYFLDELLEYDVIGRRWRKVQVEGVDRPLPRSRFALVHLPDDCAFIIGGMLQHDERTGEAWLLDLKRMAWRRAPVAPVPPVSAHTAVLAGPNCLAVYGGSNSRPGPIGEPVNTLHVLRTLPTDVSLKLFAARMIHSFHIPYK
jgi:N-acetylneuraminic acid mutarotase